MCDCYSHRCEDCENVISMHIADFCVPREVVHVLCPECLRKRTRANEVWSYVLAHKGTPLALELVTDWGHIVRKHGDRWYELRSMIGRAVGIWCDDAKGHGIHLN